jgi:hypothetical protein
MTARCDRCGAPIHRIRPAEGTVGSCADVYAPEMAGMTEDQREIWRRRVDAAQHDVECQNAGVEEDATVAVNDYIVALEAVAVAAREYVEADKREDVRTYLRKAEALRAALNKEAK